MRMKKSKKVSRRQKLDLVIVFEFNININILVESCFDIIFCMDVILISIHLVRNA